MRTTALVIALGAAAACTDEPSVEILVPLPDTAISAVVELRMRGHHLSNTEPRVYLDLQRYSDLLTSTFPAECEDCMFTISFAGASIPNGPHTIGIYFFDGETQVATDAVPLVFAR